MWEDSLFLSNFDKQLKKKKKKIIAQKKNKIRGRKPWSNFLFLFFIQTILENGEPTTSVAEILLIIWVTNSNKVPFSIVLICEDPIREIGDYNMESRTARILPLL